MNGKIRLHQHIPYYMMIKICLRKQSRNYQTSIARFAFVHVVTVLVTVSLVCPF